MSTPNVFGEQGMLWLAHAIASEVHKGQTDKAGFPYIGHPTRVAIAVLHLGPMFVAAALLHDVVEDSSITVESLRERGVPAPVYRAVDALTHRKGERRAAYYRRVAADPIALAVKRADIADNTDPVRLSRLDGETAERLRVKYAQALLALDVLDDHFGSTEEASNGR